MTENLPISVCVITLNEEENIERCLNSVQWADELLVVDSGSEDRTCEIAEECGARVVYNEWPGFIEQKQYATEAAKHDWVLNLDADEEVSEELRKGIFDLFKTSPAPDTAFKVNRLSWYLGQWIYHGSFYPDYVCRLFNRNKVHWSGYEPHAHPEGAENIVKLDGHLYHYPYEDLSDHMEFLNDYTTTMAREKDNEGTGGSVTKALAHSSFKFVKDYFLKRGFLDGSAGLVVAVMGTFYNFLKYAKLWERQNVEKEEPETKP